MYHFICHSFRASLQPSRPFLGQKRSRCGLSLIVFLVQWPPLRQKKELFANTPEVKQRGLLERARANQRAQTREYPNRMIKLNFHLLVGWLEFCRKFYGLWKLIALSRSMRAVCLASVHAARDLRKTSRIRVEHPLRLRTSEVETFCEF